MQALQFRPGAYPERAEPVPGLPDEGYLWIDFARDEAPDWADQLRATTGLQVFEAHVVDSLNAVHPSFYDATEGYEMIVFRGLSPDAEALTFATHPMAFFLFERALVTIRPPDAVSIPAVAKRLLDRSIRIPQRPAGLLHLVLNAVVDRFLALREPLGVQLEEWQDSLLNPNDPFDDWLSLMKHRNGLRRLENLSQEQLDAIGGWREATRVELDDSLAVRYNDLGEHIARVLGHAQHLQSEIDSLVQIHFAAVAHRTNEIMRVLTVLAAIFLPLTLVAGIFGMNFEHMPELKLPYAYFATLAAMVTIGIAMMILFKKKKWI